MVAWQPTEIGRPKLRLPYLPLWEHADVSTLLLRLLFDSAPDTGEGLGEGRIGG
jgi:hypothetical protein